ncbi:hypothetical protein GC176_03450 [bacterium]|nr:hypothetical protein [bacterium]
MSTTTFSNRPEISPKEQALGEQLLCFAAAAGCTVVGGIGWLINELTSIATSLEALLIIGDFYLLNGVIAWWRARELRVLQQGAMSEPVETAARARAPEVSEPE